MTDLYCTEIHSTKSKIGVYVYWLADNECQYWNTEKKAAYKINQLDEFNRIRDQILSIHWTTIRYCLIFRQLICSDTIFWQVSYSVMSFDTSTICMIKYETFSKINRVE